MRVHKGIVVQWRLFVGVCERVDVYRRVCARVWLRVGMYGSYVGVRACPCMGVCECLVMHHVGIVGVGARP